jgi:uncharacterized phage-associated protein
VPFGLQPGYNVRKAAHIVAHFALKAGGSINVLKLVKLAYLADRQFLAEYDEPILFDRLVSMEHGPVDSTFLSLINGEVENLQWTSIISAKANHFVGLNEAVRADNLDELSDAEVGVLDSVWQQFGHMTQWELRDYTHDNCPEWEDPFKSSYVIPYERIFKYLGRGEHSEALARDIETRIELDRALAQASDSAVAAVA